MSKIIGTTKTSGVYPMAPIKALRLPKYGTIAANRVANTVKIERDRSLEIIFRALKYVFLEPSIGFSKTSYVGWEYIKELTMSWTKINRFTNIHIHFGTYWMLPVGGNMFINITPFEMFPKAQYPDIAIGMMVINMTA